MTMIKVLFICHGRTMGSQ